MKGGFGPKPVTGGFTIIETMIVLAITGALLIAAMTVISGRQAHTQFSQAIQQMQAGLQQTMDDVSNGFYQNNGNITCTTGGLGGAPKLTTAPAEEGTNSDCMFLGKVVQFSVGGQADQYNTYSIVGLKGGVLTPATTLAVAKPRLIAQSSTDAPTVPDVYTHDTTQFGLTVVNMYYGTDPTANHVGAVAFIASMNGLSAANNTQQVDVAAIPGTNLGMSKVSLVDQANAVLKSLPSAAVDPPGGVHICFKSAGTTQSALLNIGGKGRQSSMTLDVFQDVTCT